MNNEVPVIADTVVVDDYYLAVTLVYAGCPLVSITRREHHTDFLIVCKECDYEIYRKDYYANCLQVADIRTFSLTIRRIGKIVRDLPLDEPWINPDYVHNFLTDGGEHEDWRD